MLRNFEYDYNIEIFIYKLRIKTLDKNEIEKIMNRFKEKRKIKKQHKIRASKILKKIEIEELDINFKIGLLHVLPTIFSIPIISAIISSIYTLIKRNNNKIKYNIKPIYNEFTIQAKVTGTISFRIFNLIKP